MESQRYVVMGAGEVGFHLARSLSREGHSVIVVELAPERRDRVEELDVLVVTGNGAHAPVLEEARIGTSDLFMAVSSDDEANFAASILAKRLGAARCVVRVGAAAEVLGERRLYEEVFGADLLLSTQLLTTSRILNHIRGLQTVAVESFAGGMVQLRKISLEAGSLLVRQPLHQAGMPANSLVVAYFRGEELIVPGGGDRAEPGDEALVLATLDAWPKVERKLATGRENLGTTVIAGAGETGLSVARSLLALGAPVKIIERDRERARRIAAKLPRAQILHGDATDLTLLKAERIADARSFAALTGNDETNLMASLLAQELHVPEVVPMVQRAENTHLWRRLGFEQVFSPRSLAYEHIHEYIETGYSAHIVSLSHGAAQVIERRLHSQSPAAGVTLTEMSPPRGLIVGAVVRGKKVFVPRGKDRLEAGDLVILFVQEPELGTVQLLFPGKGSATAFPERTGGAERAGRR